MSKWLLLVLGGCITFQHTVQTQSVDLTACTVDDPTCYGPLPPPELAFAPSGVDFSFVDVGAPAQVEVTLQNIGRRSLDPFSISPPDGPFKVVTNSCTAEDLHESCTVVISFEPAIAGVYSGTLTAQLGAGGTAVLPLSGVGRDYLTVTVALVGDGDGRIQQVAGPLDCPGACVVAIPRTGPNTSALFDIASDAASTLPPVITGCDVLNDGSCFLQLTGDRSVSVTLTRKTYQVTLTKDEVTLPSGGYAAHGLVSLGPQLCEPTCTAGIKHGTPITINASSSDSRAGPGGVQGAPCDGVPCTFAVTGPMALTGIIAPYNTAFVTSAAVQVFDIFVGLAQADAVCQSFANGSGNAWMNGRTWRAWLAQDGVNAFSRLGTARGWLLSDGSPLADRLVPNGSQLFQRLALDESGAAATSPTQVYTGANGNGAPAADNCANWTKGDPSANVTMGNWQAGDGVFSASEIDGCGISAHLYCFSTDARVPLILPTGNGRHAFPTDALIAATGGIAAFDAACRQDAVVAGLCAGSDPSCPVLALVAPNGATAASRFAGSSTSTPIFRLDNAQLATNQTTLFSGALFSGIDWTAANRSVGDDTVWTGVSSSLASSAGTPASTCNNWSGGTGEFGWIGDIGPASGGTGFFAFGSTGDCAVPRHVYCLEK